MDMTFDCIAFKRKVQAEHYERTRHMTDEQWLADLHQSVATGPPADWWARVRRQPDAAAPGPRRDDTPAA